MLSNKPLFTMLLGTAVILLFILLFQPFAVLQFKSYLAVLYPSGIIALEERNLLLFIQALMLLVIIPVYILTFVFSWKYRAQKNKDNYDPNLTHSYAAEIIWWGIPLVITLIIGSITWIQTHQLDPYKPIESDKKQITIQAVALQWKWLFIYPDEKIASVNFIQIPKDTPIHFEITADAPMNSLWIPNLGGQIYAMPNMKTELNLIANETGDFRGSSANISGVGFSGMHFITRSSSQEEYDSWIKSAKESTKALTFDQYEQLSAPSQNNQVEIYLLEEENLFHRIMEKYGNPKKS